MKRLLPFLLIAATVAAVWLLLPDPAGGGEASQGAQGEEQETPGAAPALEREDIALEREGLAVVEEPVIEEPETFEIEEEEFLPESEQPPDPLQFGESALQVTLLDSLTKERVSGTVQLWRLNAPGNEGWHSGDQLQHQAEAVDGLFFADRLPEGEYRLFAMFAKAGAESGPSFQVEGRSTAMTQEVIMPHVEQLSLVLYRADGTRILGTSGEGISWSAAGTRSSMTFDLEPSWLNRRWPRQAGIFESMAMGGGWSGGHHRSWQPLEPEFFGFALGEARQDSRGNRTHYRFFFREDEGPSMAVRVRPEGARSYLAVFLTPEEVQERLVLPAGVPYRDLRGNITIEVEALALHHADHSNGEVQDEEALLLEVPVHITIRAQGFERLKRTWKMGEGRLPELLLSSAEEQ